jgi:hypothetical protein
VTPQRINLALAVIFLIVGILATSNTIRLNNYIKETLPRDQAQEQCNTKTIEVLKSWIEARVSRDSAMDARDDAAVVVLDQELNGLVPTAEQIMAWRDAVAQDRRVRADAAVSRVPLPDC